MKIMGVTVVDRAARDLASLFRDNPEGVTRAEILRIHGIGNNVLDRLDRASAIESRGGKIFPTETGNRFFHRLEWPVQSEKPAPQPVVSSHTQEELQAEIDRLSAELRKLKEEEKRKRMSASEPVYVYEVTRKPMNAWDRIWDSTISNYRVSRKCANETEAKAAGHMISAGDQLAGDRVEQIVHATGKLIAGWGGGLVLVQEEKEALDVSSFIRANPEGGDVTHLFGKH